MVRRVWGLARYTPPVARYRVAAMELHSALRQCGGIKLDGESGGRRLELGQQHSIAVLTKPLLGKGLQMHFGGRDFELGLLGLPLGLKGLGRLHLVQAGIRVAARAEESSDELLLRRAFLAFLS